MSAAAVLFVDDEPSVTEALRVALRSEPFTVLTANSAESGLELLRKQRIDVVVSDECMPGLNGAAFLATVRAEFPRAGRVILTGQASVEATIAAVNDAQVFQVLTKPCPVATIVESPTRSRLVLSLLDLLPRSRRPSGCGWRRNDERAQPPTRPRLRPVPGVRGGSSCQSVDRSRN